VQKPTAMGITRRSFVGKAGILTAGAAVGLPNMALSANWKEEALKWQPRLKANSPEENAKDEAFWAWVRQCYTLNYNLINLNNGGVSPQPKSVQDAVDQHYHQSNQGPSYYMWRILDQGREPLRRELAEYAGCSPEELAINRNASEALETIIFGLNLKKGDEVLVDRYDYPNMLNAWKQREKREGIVLVYVNLDPVRMSDAQVKEAYVSKMSKKTKVVHVTHLINWNGRILPVKEIANEAKARGIEVLCDGAHSFAHVPYSIPDLNCDYYGTSLHKWLSAPFGTGMMYIRKEKIASVWPLLAPEKPESDDIRKFESLGTRNFALEQGIREALDFQQLIGNENKHARLQYLKSYWTGKVASKADVEINTPLSPESSCSLVHLGYRGKTGAEIEQHLFGNFKVHCVAIDYEGLKGVRITPHVYTSLRDLDVLVEGVMSLS